MRTVMGAKLQKTEGEQRTPATLTLALRVRSGSAPAGLVDWYDGRTRAPAYAPVRRRSCQPWMSATF